MSLERLGRGAENATWRNAYLTGAQELRSSGIDHTELSSAGLAPALTVTQLFDAPAIRIVGPAAWDERFSIAWHVTDTDERYRMELSNGALIHYPLAGDVAADLSVSVSRSRLPELLATGSTEGVDLSGDLGVLARLSALIDDPDPDFAIVTP